MMKVSFKFIFNSINFDSRFMKKVYPFIPITAFINKIFLKLQLSLLILGKKKRKKLF